MYKYDRQTDRWTDTDRQTAHDDIGRTYASHRVAKIMPIYFGTNRSKIHTAG